MVTRSKSILNEWRISQSFSFSKTHKTRCIKKSQTSSTKTVSGEVCYCFCTHIILTLRLFTASYLHGKKICTARSLRVSRLKKEPIHYSWGNRFSLPGNPLMEICSEASSPATRSGAGLYGRYTVLGENMYKWDPPTPRHNTKMKAEHLLRKSPLLGVSSSFCSFIAATVLVLHWPAPCASALSAPSPPGTPSLHINTLRLNLPSSAVPLLGRNGEGDGAGLAAGGSVCGSETPLHAPHPY